MIFPSDSESRGAIRLYISMDRCMNLVYESLVYLLNLWIVFVTHEPLDMVLNALALEFILQLDNEIKPMYLKAFPPNIAKCRDAWNIYTTSTGTDAEGQPVKHHHQHGIKMTQGLWQTLILVDGIVVSLYALFLPLCFYPMAFYLLICKPPSPDGDDSRMW